MTPFLAIDWGTSNRRVYRVGATGTVEETLRDNRGAASLTPDTFAGELAAIRCRLGDLPAVCAGMVGSRHGWIEAPYVACPLSLSALAAALVWVEPERTAIVSGAICADASHCDVMRGEEVQLLGAVEAGLVAASGLLCQPGTHSKWAWVEDGSLKRFATAMTGELYSLLRHHSLLCTQRAEDADAGADESFRAGVGDADGGDLLRKLFGIRADAVSGINLIANHASYLSGLLIGSDVHARVTAGDTVGVIADPLLGQLYSTAIRMAGGDPLAISSDDAFVAGIRGIWSMA